MIIHNYTVYIVNGKRLGGMAMRGFSELGVGATGTKVGEKGTLWG